MIIIGFESLALFHWILLPFNIIIMPLSTIAEIELAIFYIIGRLTPHFVLLLFFITIDIFLRNWYKLKIDFMKIFKIEVFNNKFCNQTQKNKKEREFQLQRGKLARLYFLRICRLNVICVEGQRSKVHVLRGVGGDFRLSTLGF